MTNNGIVYLVGAGPGDQKLITVKGLEVLKKAEVVLYDRLVNPLLLQEVDPNAELIYCGKLPDRHILRQEAINQLLVDKAKQGKVVVRLKGGDPGVFGRVGEEAEALKKENLSYEIVPGITSGIAAASYAGIPVTHRDYGTSFTVITGHDKSKDGKPSINWGALANGIDTIAFYMGIKNLPFICEQFISNGRAASTRVAIIQWGTTGRQRVVEGTLSTIVDEVEKNYISNPAITLVGDIVDLRKQLMWFENKLLLGKKIIFPNGYQKVTSHLIENGAEVLAYPKLVSKPLTSQSTYTSTLSKLEMYEEIYFTSQEGVHLFFESLISNNIDIRSIKATLYCVDKESAAMLRSKGMVAERMSSKPSFTEKTLIVGTRKDSQKFQGVHLITHEMQNSIPVSIAFRRVMDEDGFNTIIFSSPESVKLFLEQVKKDGHNPVDLAKKSQVICVGEETLLAVKQLNLPLLSFTTNTDETSLIQVLLSDCDKVV
ncbi:uroporphyrinogen-III C-methyltransferase [Anaerobacillus alkalilacustris]|uniref:Uroporphyrinogen-III C-methyltransferase n=1 Tax=Anaerobacillus alkalilacustris TaxID=393763 RepID=A0A1S2LLR0_9BACI|nr:uroporphyrinogen-III C-methyltransferase [Anaerobacillus alkalilacustris]OIJ13432.1 uroporphyrinogen-III C-methyltransferase [Anaerobacillus alkalilacustris]